MVAGFITAEQSLLLSDRFRAEGHLQHRAGNRTRVVTRNRHIALRRTELRIWAGRYALAMAETEDGTYARIAKHNGTTVDEERAKAETKRTFNPLEDSQDAIEERERNGTAQPLSEEELRARLGAKDVDEDLTASKFAVRGTGSTPEIPYLSTNPWRTSIIVIWVASIVVGVILLVIGATDYANLDPTNGSTDTGLVQLFFGSSFTTIGLVSLIAWMVGEMVLWRAPSK